MILSRHGGFKPYHFIASNMPMIAVNNKISNKLIREFDEVGLDLQLYEQFDRTQASLAASKVI
jgi:hypothetical protein